MLATALLLPAHGLAVAHEIPARVTVLAYVKPEGSRLRVLLRAPLETMRDVDFPQRGLGYLDLARATPLAREAATVWIAGYLRAWENGTELPPPAVSAVRVSLPSDRAFASWDSALARVTGAPLDTLTDVPWTQATVDVLVEYPIASAASRFAIEPSLGHLGVQTTTVLRYVAATGVERAYQYRGNPGVVRLNPGWHHAAWQFTTLGVGHILGGVDHLLFVLCLVIPFRRFRQLAVIVTAFTVAHSITLISAALGVVPDALWFPPLVETLIAASILWMALGNIVGARVERRWAMAFGFGLVHGFGFSFALAESLQFAGKHLALSLVAFNAGVEIGQLLVVGAAVPMLGWLFRRGVPERVGVIVLSAFVAHTAWHWMTARGSTLSEYQLTLPAWNFAVAASAMRGAMVLAIIAAAAWGMFELYRRIGATAPLVPQSAAGEGDRPA